MGRGGADLLEDVGRALVEGGQHDVHDVLDAQLLSVGLEHDSRAEVQRGLLARQAALSVTQYSYM